jgi:hypothetical protein
MALEQKAVSNSGSKRTFYVLSYISITGASTYIPPEGTTYASVDIKTAAQFTTVNSALRRVNSQQWAHVNLRLVRVEETTTQAGESRRLLAETECAPTFGTQDVIKYVLYYNGNPKRFAVADGMKGGHPVLTWPMDGNLKRALLFDTQGAALVALQENALGRDAEVLGDRGVLARVLVSPAKPAVTLTETVLS